MRARLSLAVLVCVSIACNRGPIAKGEPAGQAVELTAADLEAVSFAAVDLKTWAAWQGKGIQLVTHDTGVPEPERQQQAIYCFHQAMAAWPKKLPDGATELRKMAFTPEPTDTLLQLGWLYLKMKQPELALAYFKRADTYLHSSSVVTKGIADAEAMLNAK